MRPAFVAWLWSLVCVATAQAEDLVPRRVGVEVHGARATLTVTFEERIDEEGHTQRWFGLPPRAVVTDGTIRDTSGTHAMTLTPADEASMALGAVERAPRRAAMATMIQVVDDGNVARPRLEVLVPRPTTLTIDLELEAPACFADEQRFVAIPTDWVPDLPRGLARRVVGYERTDELRARCGYPTEADDTTWLQFPGSGRPRPYAGARIQVTATRLTAGDQHAARIELALASVLSEVPRDLHTVFVLDTSRSMSSDQLATARAIVLSYAAHAPRSSVQVVGFARHATPLLRQWTRGTAAQAIDASLAHVTQRNGSELQVGLREAGSWLARIRGTRRVIVLSDDRVADRVARISAATLAAELPARTLVHVVGLTGGEGLVRDDDVRWAPLAVMTEGLAARAGEVDESVGLDALALVRPTSLDHVRIVAPGWTTFHSDGAGCDGTGTATGQGASCTWWGRPIDEAAAADVIVGRDDESALETPPSPLAESITVEGMLWGRRWSRTVTLGAGSDISLARQLQFLLAPDDPLTIAALDVAQAVSSRWSLVARWGGEGGYEEGGGGGTGWGTVCGCGTYGTIGHGSGTGSGVFQVTPLRFQLADAIERCLRDDVTISLTIETTLDEIVDVAVRATVRGTHDTPPQDAEAIEACAREGVWATSIQFSVPRAHASTTLVYGDPL